MNQTKQITKILKVVKVIIALALISAILIAASGCAQKQSGGSGADGLTTQNAQDGGAGGDAGGDGAEGGAGSDGDSLAEGSGQSSGNGETGDAGGGGNGSGGDGSDGGDGGNGGNGVDGADGNGGSIGVGGQGADGSDHAGELAALCTPVGQYDSEENILDTAALANGDVLTTLANGRTLTVNRCEPNTIVNTTQDLPHLIQAVDMISVNNPEEEEGEERILSSERSSVPRLSYDKTKFAYISPYDWEVISTLYVYESEANRGRGAQFEIYFEGADYESYKPNSVTWLDNRHLLAVVQFAYGTVTLGGDVYVYDTQGLTTKKIIHTPDIMGIIHVSVKNGVATLYIGEYIDDTCNEFTEYTVEMPVSELYDLIERNAILDLKPKG